MTNEYTITLSPAGFRSLGVRASAYVEEHAIASRGGVALLVADLDDTPAGIARTLTRVCGSPRTSDRGEIACWSLGGSLVEVGMR